MDKVDWEDVGKIVGKAAPLVGSLFGPAGTAIGGIVSALIGTDNNPDAIVEALKTDPDALVKLKQYEMTHEGELKKLQLQALGMQLKDIDSARDRQSKHEEVTGTSDINLYVLAWTIVIGFFSLIGTMLFVEIPQESNNIIYMLFGTLSAGFGSVMQYFFGSSVGSKMKTLLMDKRTKSDIKPSVEEKY